ncbi:MAG: holliday junction DNA helicase RuvA [Hyphomonadaceae bacterium]|nr:MAG: holliday junction DNA helicase RuvA [Hyphomonadaceae bacterium]KAF0183559.1 MAG: holliday junction DNA helicase RuvA [Hyphomonadaceae bacterium]
MIGSLKGIVQGIYDDRALIEVQGVGYLVYLGNATLSRLRKNEAVFLYVETYVREDALKLFGFLSDTERAWFVQLQNVSGVGAKVALAILDIMTPNQIMQAAELGDKASVSRASGVGPKLAQRIVLELKGRAPPSTLYSAVEHGAFTPPSSDFETPEDRREALGDMALRNGAISALQNLGFNTADAMNAVAHAYGKFDDDPELADLVKQALKELKP